MPFPVSWTGLRLRGGALAGQDDRAALGHGVGGILHQVEQRAAQGAGVKSHGPQGRQAVHLDGHAPAATSRCISAPQVWTTSPRSCTSHWMLPTRTSDR